jgi:hypothetical protein
MGQRRQVVTDVMQQGAEDVLVVAAVPLGAGGSLQRMLQAVDRETAVIIAEHPQLGEHIVGDEILSDVQFPHDDCPIVLRRLE